MAYFINGKVKEAEETDRKALKLYPDNNKFKERLKEYEQAMTSN